jgi:hypothetical protein
MSNTSLVGGDVDENCELVALALEAVARSLVSQVQRAGRPRVLAPFQPVDQ